MAGSTFQTNPFDLHKLLDDCSRGILQLPDFQRSRVWDEDRIKSQEAAFKAHVEKFRNSLFFTKALDWEHERELRWIVSGNVGTDFYVNIEDSLIGIALGDGFPERKKPIVQKYAERNNISMAIMNWRNGFP